MEGAVDMPESDGSSTPINSMQRGDQTMTTDEADLRDALESLRKIEGELNTIDANTEMKDLADWVEAAAEINTYITTTYPAFGPRKEDIMTINLNNCAALTTKGVQCKNPRGNLTIEDDRYVCNMHLRMWSKDADSIMFVERTPVPTRTIPESPEAILAEVETKGGSIAQQYLNKENTMTMPIDVHGDHGQPNADYEAYVAEQQAADDEVQTLYEASVDSALATYQEILDENHAKLREKEEAMENAMGQKPVYVIVFTGHRPPKLGGYQSNPTSRAVKRAMKAAVKRAIAKYGDTHEIAIIWGGALGVEQWAAKLADHLGLRHMAYLPFEGFDATWPESSRDHLAELLTTACHVRYVSEPGYSAEKMMVRNRAMIDKADAVIAVWNGSKGGTANAVGYARNKKVPMVVIDPNNL
jgi:uncharacterized phage-like protein YoqJ